MKKFLTALFAIIAISPVFAAESSVNMIGVGARYHAESTIYPDLPFGDGDMSYALTYEVHDTGDDYALQFALDYAFDFSKAGSENMDYALTPAANLILKDKIWRGGVGVLKPYVKDDTGTDWADLYYQLFAGLGHRFGKIEATIMAYYPFESFSDLSDFEGKDLEYGIFASYSF